MDYLIQNSSAFAAMVNGSSYGSQKLLDSNLHNTISTYISGLSIWQVLLSILVAAIGYDQCMLPLVHAHFHQQTADSSADD